MPSYNYDWAGKINRDLLLEFNWFFRQINDRACINLGFIQAEYLAVNRKGDPDPGLGREVEYFHPTITLDDRMRYIGTVIAQKDMSVMNIVGNTFISHFYGGRGCHNAITGKDDPNDCFVDFDRIQDGDKQYVEELRKNAATSKERGYPIWGTTELHTSIQGASRNYCRVKYNQADRKFNPVDVCEWVANFRDNGVYKGMMAATHIEEMFKVLRTQKGIGEYYGFHGAASSSVLPQVKYNHDQRFVAPGPGARHTLRQLWPDAPEKLYAEAVYFLRENSDAIGLTKGVIFHPLAFNFATKCGMIFADDQDSLKYYGTEVLCCQFGIYLDIRNDPKACERRKVSRAKSFSGNSGDAATTCLIKNDAGTKSGLEEFLT
jgi:hypothetical protein